MKVAVRRLPSGFRYRLSGEASDRVYSRRDLCGTPLKLAGESWEVRLPRLFRGIHPDLHALAVYLALRPVLGRRLVLPFGVSAACAEAFARSFGVELPKVDGGLAPRREPERDAPGLLYSGGFDSSAATLLLPQSTAVCHCDRIDRSREAGLFVPDIPFGNQSARREHQCRKVRRLGRRLCRVWDDHEFLYRPYPVWHANDWMSWFSMIYLADSLGLRYIETGHVLEDMCHTGFRYDAMRSWPLCAEALGRENLCDAEPGALDRTIDLGEFRLGIFGLRKARSMAGLSTVATSRIVALGPYHGDASPCDKPFADASFVGRRGTAPSANYCAECPRCFHKRMLVDIALGRETRADTVSDYLEFPFIREELRKEFLDWHHIWVYIFQRVRCRHPLIREFQKQAQRQRDLGFLEKWHPAARGAIPAPYRASVEKNIRRYAQTMSPAEIEVFGKHAVAPLRTPAALGPRA